VTQLRLKDGNLTMLVDDGLEQLVRDAIDKVAPGLLRLVEEETRAVYEGAKGKWPVGPERRDRNGRHSRDELYHEVVIDTTKGLIRGRVWNEAPWSRYIKPKGLRGKSAYVALLRKPLQDRAKVFVTQMGRYVSAELGG
jgi:hypothetical protein